MNTIFDHMNNLQTKYVIKGVFEIHITVKCETNDELEIFLECCNKNKIQKSNQMHFVFSGMFSPG